MNVQYVHRPHVRVGDSEPTKTLFIGNLSFDMSDADFDKLFVGIDKCVDVRIAMDRYVLPPEPRVLPHANACLAPLANPVASLTPTSSTWILQSRPRKSCRELKSLAVVSASTILTTGTTPAR